MQGAKTTQEPRAHFLSCPDLCLPLLSPAQALQARASFSRRCAAAQAYWRVSGLERVERMGSVEWNDVKQFCDVRVRVASHFPLILSMSFCAFFPDLAAMTRASSGSVNDAGGWLFVYMAMSSSVER